MLKILNWFRISKIIAQNILLITIPTLIISFFVCELFFRYVIPACNLPSGYFDEDNLLYKHSSNRAGLASMSKFARQKARWRRNNHGWNSPIDYETRKAKKRIAITGDSYIEAFQVDTEKS